MHLSFQLTFSTIITVHLPKRILIKSPESPKLHVLISANRAKVAAIVRLSHI